MEGQKKCILSSCCCGCSLRTGSLIIAILSLLFGLAVTGFSIYLVVSGVIEGWVDLVVNVIGVIFAIILIHGIRTERRGLVMAWVWANSIGIALNIILAIVFIFAHSLVAACILFILAAIHIYFVLVVRSYAHILEAPQQGVA